MTVEFLGALAAEEVTLIFLDKDEQMSSWSTHMCCFAFTT
jgi:hypothetical protein